jgi:hypothetical protein
LKLHPLIRAEIDWLIARGVSPAAIIHPSLIMTCRGSRAKDGRFEGDPGGQRWFVFSEQHDLVFWNPLTGEIATDTGRAFALGEELIGNPATTAFDQYLTIFANPLQWLRNERRGIFVLNWQFAFDRLRDVPRIAVAEPLLATYHKMMKPRHMPRLAVLPKTERVAA